jgi:molybdopterin-guanine dinucleotide biosynthesis protein A
MKRSAIILAGGASSRMGTDKAFIEFQGKALIKWVIEAIENSVDKIYISLSKNQQNNYDMELPDITLVRDIYPYSSPLIGLVSALKMIKTGYAFVTACDMPFIKTELIDYLFKQSDNNPGSIVVKPDGWIEPFLSVYHVPISLLEAERLVLAGDLRIRMVARNLIYIKKISIQEIKKIDPKLQSLTDIDTIEKLSLARFLT